MQAGSAIPTTMACPGRAERLGHLISWTAVTAASKHGDAGQDDQRVARVQDCAQRDQQPAADADCHAPSHAALDEVTNGLGHRERALLDADAAVRAGIPAPGGTRRRDSVT
jgi:hypothetical protein